MATRRPLDAEMLRRGLVPDRDAAALLVSERRVLVGGVMAEKASRQVSSAEPIEILSDVHEWVSRGGNKLEGALDRFSVELSGARVLDAGCSTGGFTDVCLARGASNVHAVDVGYGVIHERLRTHPAVTVMERTNIRSVVPEQIGGTVDVVVGDLSFVSLRPIAPHLVRLVAGGGDIVVLVKPQFEADHDVVSKGRGIVTDPAVWEEATQSVIAAFRAAGSAMIDQMTSPITGTEGNTEFLLHFRRDHGSVD